MDIVKLYQDYSIPFQAEGHKHCRPGWINTPCPFCTGNPGLHLGVTEDGSHAYCWRCGYKPIKKVLSKMLNAPEKEISQLIATYGSGSFTKTKEPKAKIGVKKLKFPEPCGNLTIRHKTYLEKRGFDPDRLQKEWGLLGTSVISKLDGIDYKFRIIAPVFWNDQGRSKVVTFQARDITDRHTLKYMACPKEREIIHHKHILYGMPESWGNTGIIVEGITDVWRLGYNAVATFGIEYTNRQVREIARAFKRVVVIFDSEHQAIQQAGKLVSDLKFRGVDAFSITIKDDPGSMSQDDADHLVKNIL